MSSPFTSRGGQPFSRSGLARWQLSARGQRQLQLECAELAQVLPEIFGRHILQVGNWGDGEQLLAAADMPHRAVLGTLGDFGARSLTRPESLPLLTRSVDAMLLPHTLEFSAAPHHVLRETNRALNDRGRLLVLGFNPHSWWGLRGRLGFGYAAFPPGARFYSPGRIGDWLELLDFEVEQVRRFGVGFPWAGPRAVGEPFNLRSLLNPVMESYLIVAKKRVLPMSLIARLPRAQIRPMPIPVLSGSGAASVPDPHARRE